MFLKKWNNLFSVNFYWITTRKNTGYETAYMEKGCYKTIF